MRCWGHGPHGCRAHFTPTYPGPLGARRHPRRRRASHLSFARDDFRGQVPAWFPVDDDTVVLVSGLVEIGLGAALLAWARGRVTVGFVVAAFFVAIFPGNIAQYVEGNDAFGLDTDQKRLMRLFFQPVLVAWALWATAAWRDRPRRR